jgi:hypothetical protein
MPSEQLLREMNRYSEELVGAGRQNIQHKETQE